MYTVMLELIMKNHIIVSLRNTKNNLLVYVLIEDVFRAADLHKDFPHLYPGVYGTNEEFQADNSGYNLIRLTLFPKFNIKEVNKTSEGQKIIQEFNYMAENLVEHKPLIDHAVIWQDELVGFDEYNFKNHEELLKVLYNHILSFSEIGISDFNYNPGHL